MCTEEMAEAAPQPGKRSWWTRVLIAATIISLLTTLIQVSVKDRVPVLAILYYASPIRVAVLVAGGLALVCAASKRWIVSALNLAHFAALLAILSVQSDGNFSTATCKQKVGFWNISRGRTDYDRIFAEVAKTDWDYFGFVEFGTNRKASDLARKTHFKGKILTELDGGMALLSRERPGSRRSFVVKDSYRINEVRFEDVTVILVDIVPHVFNNRYIPIEKVREIAEDSKRVIIMGDFNTPFHSPAFDILKERFQCGAGNEHTSGRESWPYPLPVLAIDHIWLSPEFEATSYNKDGSLLSDHCMIKCGFQVR